MKSQIVQTSRGPIEYTLLGKGPVVLVCHGTSSNCFSTAESEPLVAAGFSVLTPSRPGYGRTPLEVGRSAALACEAGFTGHFFWIGPDFGPISQRLVEFLGRRWINVGGIPPGEGTGGTPLV